MTTWLPPTLLALLLWGLWGFLSKLANAYVKPTDAYLFSVMGILLAGIVIALLTRFRPGGDWRGIAFGLVSGLVMSFGAYFFYMALSRGSSAVIVTATALYPLVTLLLSYVILHEPLSPRQLVGIGLAVGAIVLLST
jgi:transporter family protein